MDRRFFLLSSVHRMNVGHWGEMLLFVQPEDVVLRTLLFLRASA